MPKIRGGTSAQNYETKVKHKPGGLPSLSKKVPPLEVKGRSKRKKFGKK
jgi:hypothetical protein